MCRAEPTWTAISGELHVSSFHAAHLAILVFHSRLLLNVVVQFARLERLLNAVRLLSLDLNTVLVELLVKRFGLLVGFQLKEVKQTLNCPSWNRVEIEILPNLAIFVDLSSNLEQFSIKLLFLVKCLEQLHILRSSQRCGENGKISLLPCTSFYRFGLICCSTSLERVLSQGGTRPLWLARYLSVWWGFNFIKKSLFLSLSILVNAKFFLSTLILALPLQIGFSLKQSIDSTNLLARCC